MLDKNIIYTVYLYNNFVSGLVRFLANLAKGNVSFCHGVSSVRRPLTFHIWIFSSETTGPIWTKLCWNGPGMVPFQNCIRGRDWPSNMAAVTKNRKKGGWFLKKSSPQKLLSQFMPNFGEMVLRWSSFRIVSDDPAHQPRWPPLPNLV